MDDASARALLRRLFDAAVAEADPAKIVPRHLPAPPKGRTIVVGAGKASAAMARAFEENWSGELLGPRRDPLRSCGALQAHRDRRGVAPGAGPKGRGRGAPDPRNGPGSRRGRSRRCAHVRRRLGAAEPARRRLEPRGQAGGQSRAARVRRVDRRDELRAQAPEPRQGRPPRRGRLAGARGDAADLGRAGRRPGDHRLRADRRRSDHLRRRARRFSRNTVSRPRRPWRRTSNRRRTKRRSRAIRDWRGPRPILSQLRRRR